MPQWLSPSSVREAWWGRLTSPKTAQKLPATLELRTVALPGRLPRPFPGPEQPLPPRPRAPPGSSQVRTAAMSLPAQVPPVVGGSHSHHAWVVQAC